METRHIKTDILIIGAGTAGCYAAYVLNRNTDYKIVVAEKTNIERNGSLTAGVNILNVCTIEGNRPEDYVEYAKKFSHGILRSDLLLSMAQRANKVTKELERLGLVIRKDEKGNYVAGEDGNILVSGKNVRSILVKAASYGENTVILNHVNITDYIVKKNRILGAVGFGVNENIFYEIEAKTVICAMGGAAGASEQNDAGFSRHKKWYCLPDSGAGYAMGLKAGAKMTTFEKPCITDMYSGCGYWIDEGRRTTINGLFAAGDVAGGCPKKYLAEVLAEGEMAAESVIAYLENKTVSDHSYFIKSSDQKKREYETHFPKDHDMKEFSFTTQQLEETLQKRTSGGDYV